MYRRKRIWAHFLPGKPDDGLSTKIHRQRMPPPGQTIPCHGMYFLARQKTGLSARISALRFLLRKTRKIFVPGVTA
jgi:hypothetical protein